MLRSLFLSHTHTRAHIHIHRWKGILRPCFQAPSRVVSFASDPYEWHTHRSHVTYMSNVTHVNGSCHKYDWVALCSLLAIYMNNTHIEVMSKIWVISHMWMSQVTHATQRHVIHKTQRDTYEWLVIHMRTHSIGRSQGSASAMYRVAKTHRMP